MEEIVKVTKSEIAGEEQQAVNARDLWKFLQSKRQFADWFKKRVNDYGFIEGEDFTVHKFVKGEHGRFAPKEYTITLDMAKELAMVENNGQGRKARRYFIAVEKEFRKQSDAARCFAGDPQVLIATLYTEMERRIKAEAQRDEYRSNLERIANASNLNFGELSRSTGLPKDIIVATHCKSSSKVHAPQTQRYLQLILPLDTIVREAQKMISGEE